MSAAVIALPEARRGRRSADQEALYQRELETFAAAIRELQSSIEFRVSSRGWCYILEEHGLHKGDFDRAQRLLNDCRKSGLLPLGICKEDDARAVTGLDNLGRRDPWSPEECARMCIRRAREQIASAYGQWRETCASYEPVGWTDGLKYAVFVLVEKVDLVTLFERPCSWSHVPIANAKGWSDLHLRAAMMRYFREAEAEGRTPVLLYCGDHDPAGLLISSTLKKQLADLSRAVDWSPDNLIVDRFGLNADFIRKHKLTWIENLQSGSGADLAVCDRSYVKDYIEKFGARKCEANALVTRPDAAEALIREAIAKYVPKDWIILHRRRNEGAREEALAAFDELRDADEA